MTQILSQLQYTGLCSPPGRKKTEASAAGNFNFCQFHSAFIRFYVLKYDAQ